ncbi:hypothetical protein T459_13947 [Capsicum annuum]|uniref:Bet v I/Major latex protein domain-containing protein n=1 Tax=Capsicum annuum TaxID=4072 RepID=A0A2G2ZG06_CAPAN|nr:hypothetical protein T459_13947 [Capsicum annuum]
MSSNSEEKNGVKGKLTVSIEVKCGAHFFHDIFHANAHNIDNISPNKISRFDIHEGENVKISSIISWKYNEGNTRFSDLVLSKVFTFINFLYLDAFHNSYHVMIEGNVLELYNSFTLITFGEHHWTTLAFIYEKKAANIPEPLSFGFFL